MKKAIHIRLKQADKQKLRLALMNYDLTLSWFIRGVITIVLKHPFLLERLIKKIKAYEEDEKRAA